MEDIHLNLKSDCRINNIGFVSVLRNENHVFEFKNGKERYSFIFVENGEVEYLFTRTHEKIKTDKKSLIYIPKSFPYKITYLKKNTKVKIFIFGIETDKIPEYLKMPIQKKSFEIVSVFNSISKDNMRNNFFLYSKIYELLYIIQDNTLKISKKYKPIAAAEDEINQHYFENKKISYYADMCNMSESNFRKSFKEYTGKSPIEYRNIIRITEAKKMIDSGEFTVGEAAYLTGFNNMTAFYNAYNKYVIK